MGGANAGSSGSNDTQVSGYEAEINKQKAKEKAQKEAFGKYDKSNTNPNDNIQKQKKKTLTTTNNGGGGDNNNTITQVTCNRTNRSRSKSINNNRSGCRYRSKQIIKN